MPLELTPEVQVTRDRDGNVRSLSHLQGLYRPDLGKLLRLAHSEPETIARALAEQYLREGSDVFRFSRSELENFDAPIDPGPTDAGIELRFREQKGIGEPQTVSYYQTVLGLPNWDAGVSVRIDRFKKGVSGVHNTTHYQIDPVLPRQDSRFLPEKINEEVFRQLLELEANDQFRVNSKRAFVYRYRTADRFDPHFVFHDDRSGTNKEMRESTHTPPIIPLRDVPSTIKENRHYVVTEILFEYRLEGWGTLNWRAFVEPESGAILYLRALVASASTSTGSVFPNDPASFTGFKYNPGTDRRVLNELRKTVCLLGLRQPAYIGGKQELHGEFVKLEDLEDPRVRMPVKKPPYNFEYDCDTDDFAACSAYYHCDGVFRLIEGMGININDYFRKTTFPVPVDPHAKKCDVDASTQGNTGGAGLKGLVFGRAMKSSKFGIAADIRVVLHEFGHAILLNHIRATSFGFAHSPGDSLGAILLDPVSHPKSRFFVFPFMNHVPIFGRMYNRDVAAGWAWGGKHDDGLNHSEEILTTSLFRIYRAAGGDSTELSERKYASRYVVYLIFKAVGLLSENPKFAESFVDVLTEADGRNRLFEGHPGGAFSKVIRWAFEMQGLYHSNRDSRTVDEPGQPPKVDVYIDDGRDGHYMPFQEDFRGNAEIWNLTGPSDVGVDQAPVVGKENYAFVRVKNRGTLTAESVVVRGYQSRRKNAETWPDDWEEILRYSVGMLSIPPGGESVVGPFPWTPKFEGESLLFGVSAIGDKSNLETVVAGPIPNARLVRLDNNTAQRQF